MVGVNNSEPSGGPCIFYKALILFLVISSKAKKRIEQIIAGIEKPGAIKFVASPNPICIKPDNQKRRVENFIEIHSANTETGRP